jgi:hypothetical protein
MLDMPVKVCKDVSMTAKAELRWEPLDEDPTIGMVVIVATGRPFNIVPIPLQDACEILSPAPIRVRIN